MVKELNEQCPGYDVGERQPETSAKHCFVARMCGPVPIPVPDDDPNLCAWPAPTSTGTLVGLQ